VEARVSGIVHYGYPVLIALYAAVSMISFLAARRETPSRLASSASLIASSATLVVWTTRWIDAGHFPLFGTYENALSGALAIVLVATAFDVAKRGVAVTPAAFAIAALLLGQGIQYDAMPYGLTISERSLVVDIHAVLAWLALAFLATASALAVQVALARGPSRFEPHLERLLTIGFVLHTAMIASGSFYKFLLFGKVWSWDPIETMALISWLLYGTLLHMSLLAGWSGRRFARWTIASFAVLAVSYRSIIYFPSFATYHVFDIALKLHR
jgi:ABC-type transport system involved in cytochrome c biogenesis permease subunit